MLQTLQQDGPLLSGTEMAPVEAVNPSGASPFVLTCEHAGRAIPRCLGDLGIDAAEMDRHIAYDIGAENLARAMSARLDAPLFLQRYSRLVVDCNRPFEADDCFPEISDGTFIPANRQISEAARRQRFFEIHQPFHHAVASFLDGRRDAGTPAVVISVHSFTPRMAGIDRPWLIGLLSNRDRSFAEQFMATFAAANPGICIAHNQPYRVDDQSDYVVPVHGEARGIPHLLLEIRNDQIARPEGQEKWARLVSDALLTTNEKGCHSGN